MVLLAAERSARPKKQARSVNSCWRDRLSKLSDELLLLVLRRLPAMEAVRTGSLARRWRHLPSLLPVQPHLLVGNPFSPLQPKLPPYLSLDLDAIDRALAYETNLLKGCHIVPATAPEESRVKLWAEALARRGIRELVFDLRRQPGSDASSFVTLCRSLFKLDLRSGSLFPQTLCIWLPSQIFVGCVSLTHLRLVEVEVSDFVLLAITSACPKLMHLELIGCKGLQWFRLEEMQSLKELSFHSRDDAQDDDLRSIDIDGPNLEVLNLRTSPPSYGYKVVAPKLRSVYLCLPRTRRRFFPAAAEGLRRLIQSASNVACLHLRGGAVDCLSIGRQPDNLGSSFLNLKRLYVNLVLLWERQALCLAALLQQFPALEQLNLFIMKWEVNYEGASPPSLNFEEHQWRMERVSSIRSNLKYVTISGCMGERYEMNFTAFILTKARALKKLTLNLNSKCSNAGEISAYSLVHVVRASPNAKLIVKKSG